MPTDSSAWLGLASAGDWSFDLNEFRSRPRTVFNNTQTKLPRVPFSAEHFAKAVNSTPIALYDALDERTKKRIMKNGLEFQFSDFDIEFGFPTGGKPLVPFWCDVRLPWSFSDTKLYPVMLQFIDAIGFIFPGAFRHWGSPYYLCKRKDCGIQHLRFSDAIKHQYYMHVQCFQPTVPYFNRASYSSGGPTDWPEYFTFLCVAMRVLSTSDVIYDYKTCARKNRLDHWKPLWEEAVTKGLQYEIIVNASEVFRHYFHDRYFRIPGVTFHDFFNSNFDKPRALHKTDLVVLAQYRADGGAMGTNFEDTLSGKSEFYFNSGGEPLPRLDERYIFRVDAPPGKQELLTIVRNIEIKTIHEDHPVWGTEKTRKNLMAACCGMLLELDSYAMAVEHTLKCRKFPLGLPETAKSTCRFLSQYHKFVTLPQCPRMTTEHLFDAATEMIEQWLCYLWNVRLEVDNIMDDDHLKRDGEALMMKHWIGQKNRKREKLRDIGTNLEFIKAQERILNSRGKSAHHDFYDGQEGSVQTNEPVGFDPDEADAPQIAPVVESDLEEGLEGNREVDGYRRKRQKKKSKDYLQKIQAELAADSQPDTRGESNESAPAPDNDSNRSSSPKRQKEYNWSEGKKASAVKDYYQKWNMASNAEQKRAEAKREEAAREDRERHEKLAEDETVRKHWERSGRAMKEAFHKARVGQKVNLPFEGYGEERVRLQKAEEERVKRNSAAGSKRTHGTNENARGNPMSSLNHEEERAAGKHRRTETHAHPVWYQRIGEEHGDFMSRYHQWMAGELKRTGMDQTSWMYFGGGKRPIPYDKERGMWLDEFDPSYQIPD